MPDQSKEKASAKIRHERFAREFVIDHNARRAYMVVYGVEDIRVADAAASRLMKVKRVRELINKLEQAAHARLEISKDKIEKEIASVAFVDFREFYNDDGTLKPPRQWTREMAAAVRSLETEELFSGRGDDRVMIGFSKKLTLWDRLGANALLGAPHGIGVKKVEIGKPGDFNPNEKVEDVRKRVVAKGSRLGMVVQFPGGKKK